MMENSQPIRFSGLPAGGGGDDDPAPSMRRLWRAVLAQALMDAGRRSSKEEIYQEKRRAVRWLQGNSVDFIIVCHHAGLEPEYVQRRAKKAIARGCAWRKGQEERSEQIRLPITPLSMDIRVLPRMPQRPVRFNLAACFATPQQSLPL